MTPPPPNDAPPADLPAPVPSPASPAPARVFQTLDRRERRPYSGREYLGRYAWQVVQATIWRVPRMFALRRWLLRRFGGRVTSTTFVHHGARVMHPWLFETGEWATLSDEVEIYNLGPVSIGSHTTLSQGTYVCAGTHDYTVPHLPLRRPSVRIGSGVWVAAQAFIGPGVTVGDNAVVGARAVVTRDVPPGVVVAGNPARVIKPRPMPAGA